MLAGLYLARPAPFKASGQSNIAAISAAAAITLWAYTGLESATVPSGEVEEPEKTIPRATILGVLVASGAVISTLGTPANALVLSNALAELMIRLNDGDGLQGAALAKVALLGGFNGPKPLYMGAGLLEVADRVWTRYLGCSLV